MSQTLNYIFLTITCLLTVSLPSFLLDYEVLYLNLIGLSYLAFYIFFISKNSLFDLTATAFLLSFGLIFDSLLSNYGFYFYGLVDYPFFTTPPTWAAVLWLVVPLQFYKLKFKYKFAPAAFIHVSGLIVLEKRDLVFIEQPYEQNLVFTFILWFVIYRLLFRFLKMIETFFFKVS